ncbi:MAG TPA: hypothetical protein VHX86_07940 [Tepidisphaeraceae bacterium]|nr:hypothetical protein [Tepidisphaeraceae bacterium]
MRCRTLVMVVAAVGLGLGCAASVYGDPITYETQARSVSASSSTTGFARGGTAESPTTLQQNQSQQANGFGDFDGSASATSAFGPNSPMSTASSQQQSSLNANGFSASGSVTANSSLATQVGPASSSASTAFHITFDVSQPESYTFNVNLNSSVDPAVPGNTSASIRFTNAQGDNVFAPLTTVNLPAVQIQGTLAAGVYSLAMDAQAASNDQSTNFVNYNFSLLDGSGSPTLLDGNSGAPAVPLPPAASATLAMLASLAAIGYVRRRYRGWVRLAMV